MYCNIVAFVILCITFGITIGSFPKCEEILREDNGKVPCHYCASERLSQDCKDLCQSKGCTKGSGSKSEDTNTKNKEATGNGGGGESKSQNSNTNSGSSGSCNNVDPCVELQAANKQFVACCKDKQLSTTCHKYCRYDASKKEIQNAFMHHECELGESRDFLYCAANDKDNNYCCKQTKVTVGDREICEPFCNPASENWPKKAELKYLKCLSQFDQIMKCHWAARRP